MNDTSSLEAACSLFLQNSKANPFDTWLIVENEDVRRRAFEIINTPVLQSRITTIKSLAHTILEEQKAGIRIIPPEEQYLLFSSYAKGIFPSSKSIIENLIDLFITLTLNKVECPLDTEKGRKAFEVFPSEPAFLELASIGDYNMGRYDEVMELCDKVLEVAPRDSSRTLRAWSTKGDLYHNAGDSKKAYKAYDKALKINPDYEYVLNNYAYYLSVEGKKLKKAYEMSRKTIEKEPNNATYLDTFGWIVYLQGRPMEAKPFFKRAMLYGGKDSAVILDHYAEVLFALKEYDMAFVYWSLAKQKNSEGEIPDLEEKIQQKKQEAGR
jgi:tetratricopeptide (TPR) repeat protein